MGEKERIILYYRFRSGLAEADVKQEEEKLEKAREDLAHWKGLLEQAEKEQDDGL